MLKRILTWHRLPFWFFHLPTVPYHVYLALRNLDPFYFGSANPIMARGDFGGVGKWDLLSSLAPEALPATLVAPPGTSVEEVARWMTTHRLAYPLISKPNQGERGSDVRRIHSDDDLREALSDASGDLLVQEYVGGIEAGALLVRPPGREPPYLASLAVKEKLSVTADGRSALRQLVLDQTPARFHDRLLRINRQRADSVPPPGTLEVEFVAQPFLGTRLRSLQDRDGEALCRALVRITDDLAGFSIGRFDLKAPSVDALLAGRDLKVLELNLTASIPLHIWDARYSGVYALRELCAHWRRVAALSRAHRARGAPRMRLRHVVSYLTRFLARQARREA